MFPTLSFGNDEIAPADLAARAAKAAGFLASIGLTDGDTFAVMLRNQPALVEIMLAARQLGAYFVPLNWHFTAAETSFILRDSGAKVLIIGGDLLPGVAAGIPGDMPVYHVRPLARGAAAQGDPPTGRAIGMQPWRARSRCAAVRTSSAAWFPTRRARPDNRRAFVVFLRAIRRRRPSAWAGCISRRSVCCRARVA